MVLNSLSAAAPAIVVAAPAAVSLGRMAAEAAIQSGIALATVVVASFVTVKVVLNK